MTEPRAEAIIATWVSIGVVFATVVTSWAVLGERTVKTQETVTHHVRTIDVHESRITKLENDQTLDRKIDKLSWQLEELQKTVNELPQKRAPK